MRIYIVCLSVLMNFLFITISAQNLTIRKAFETKTDDDNKPATFSFTNPKGNANSFLINAGIGYDFYKINRIKTTLGGFFVYNINNQIGKEQNNYKLGITGNTLFDLSKEKNTWGIIGRHSLQIKRDFVDTNYSAIASTYWHLISKKQKSIKLSGYANPSKRVAYFFTPLLGLEYQNMIENLKKSEKTLGSDFRIFFGPCFNFLIRKGKVDSLKGSKFIEFVFEYDYRQSITNTIVGADKNSQLLKCGLNIYPLKANNDFSIGIKYNNGANPMDGIKNQEYWMISFQYIISPKMK